MVCVPEGMVFVRSIVMSKFVNSVFLVSGTAIGSGLISLPISAAKLGMRWTVAITLLAFLVAYKTSCLTVELMKNRGRPLSIVELSSEISGGIAKSISMSSLYALSLALLCAYFAGTSSILGSFFELSPMLSALVCIAVFLALFLTRAQVFNKLNSGMMFVLLTLIVCVICTIPVNGNGFNATPMNCDFATMMPFLPIIFTSFGVQNVCPYVAQNMGLDDMKAIKKVFLIGTLIPAIVYVSWIYAVLARVYVFDNALYIRVLEGNIDVGELVGSLCNSAYFKFEAVILKLLSLFAILTSAAGTGVGLITSLKETVLGKSKTLILFVVIGIPTALTLLIPNAFIRILSFGGMIATTFVIFMPVFLNTKMRKLSISDVLCFIFGMLVVWAELFM